MVEDMTHWLFPANKNFIMYKGPLMGLKHIGRLTQRFWLDAEFIYLATPYKQIGVVCDILDAGLYRDSKIKHIHSFF